jgi:putative ABC transport system permease protein
LTQITSVIISTFLILGCALISWWQGHRLEKDLILSSGRVILQLSLLGVILSWLFQHTSPGFTLLAAAVMTINSALHSSTRVRARYPGIFLDHLMATTIALWPLAFLGAQLVDQNQWWRMEVLLPLIGMMLGNTLNGLSLGIDHFTHEIREKKDEVLTLLSLGATTKESSLSIFRRSLKLSLTPTINSMLSMGIVSIPGMMTGQILAGSSPMEAALTQIIVMFLIATGTYLGTMFGLKLAQRKLFNIEGQPCFE